MISSEEFQQTLENGQIQAALALILRDATELDITTRIAPDSLANSQSDNSEYIRTKINLLTGKIQNEVGKDAIEGSANYIKLQQLHTDEIVTSHQIVQSYLDRIRSIAIALSAPQVVDVLDLNEHRLPLQQNVDPLGERIGSNTLVSIPEKLSQDRVDNLVSTTSDVCLQTATIDESNLDSLVMRLTQAKVMARNSASGANSISSNLQQAESIDKCDFFQQQSSTTTSDNNRTPVDPIAIDDDDLDLSIDPDGAVWEEWVEDEDFMSDSPHSASNSSPLMTPDWEEYSVRRQFNPIDLKPTIPRNPPGSTHPSAKWDNFVPEYIGINSAPQPPISDRLDLKADGSCDDNRVDRLSIDLDI